MWWRTARYACLLLLEGLGGAAADALENVTIHGEEYLSIEELQQALALAAASSTACVRWALWVSCRKAVR